MPVEADLALKRADTSEDDAGGSAGLEDRGRQLSQRSQPPARHLATDAVLTRDA